MPFCVLHDVSKYLGKICLETSADVFVLYHDPLFLTVNHILESLSIQYFLVFLYSHISHLY
jgi:hypothetical protein